MEAARLWGSPWGGEGEGAPSPLSFYLGGAGAEAGFRQSQLSEHVPHEVLGQRCCTGKTSALVRLKGFESSCDPEQGTPLSQPQFPQLDLLYRDMMARCR